MLVFLAITFLFAHSVSGQTATAPSSGSGTASDPYEIATLENLYWIADNSSRWDKHYVQTADIDASPTSSWFSGKGWDPIGDGNKDFTGSYDGQGYTIDDLFMDRTSSSNKGQGLFGRIEDATISNLGLKNLDITGYEHVGGLVGRVDFGSKTTNTSTITGCNVTGKVEATYATVGGMVGSLRNGALILNSYSTASVTQTGGFNEIAGGLVGEIAYNGASVKRCYATGSVDKGSGNEAGGLVGHLWSTSNLVKNCYAKGLVTGGKYVGGLIGENDGASVKYSYSTGSVSGNSLVGGLIGGGNGTITGCYWDETSSGHTTSSGGSGIANTSDMQGSAAETNMSKFDWTDIWTSVPGEYPRLRVEPREYRTNSNGDWKSTSQWEQAFPGGSWHNASEVPVDSVAEDITIKNNIDLNNDVSFSGINITVNGDLDFNGGKIELGPNDTLFFTTSGTLTGGSASSYVAGKIAIPVNTSSQTTKTFPVGKSGNYRKVELIADQNSSDSTLYIVEQIEAAAPNGSSLGSGIDKVSDVRYFSIDQTPTENGNYQVKLSWGSDDGVSDKTQLRVARYDGSTWVNEGKSSTNGTTSSGDITSNSFSAFSDFALANDNNGSNSLPVEMLSFKANLKNDFTWLTWTTASETNNRHFVVQKRIDDQWQAIGTVEGHGTATSKHSYTFEDRDYQQGNTAYYRLKQVDFDGSFEYSEVRAVSSELAEAFRLTTYPNPVRDRLILTVNAVHPEKATVVIRNALGQQVLSHRISLQKGKNREALSLNSLKSGPYFLSIKTMERGYHQKIVKE
jgi:hypothetical protein